MPACLVLGVMFVAHIPTGVVFVMAISAYALLLPLLRRHKRPRWKAMGSSVLRTWAAVFVALMLAAVWVVPFLCANALANREGLSYIPVELVASYDFAKTLGFTAPEPAYRMTFPVILVLLAFVGIVAGILRRQAPLLWGVIAFGAVLFVAMPGLWMGLVQKFGFLWEATNDRAILMTIVFLPATAAYGVGAAARLLVRLGQAAVAAMVRKKPISIGMTRIANALRSGTTAVLSMAMAGSAVIWGVDLVANRHGYGMQYWDGGVPLAFQDGKLTLLDPPEWALSTEGIHTNQEDIEYFTDVLGFDESTRLDVSASMGGITQSLSLYSDASIINIYGFNASLMHAMWGYQSKVCYGDSTGTSNELNELAKWFGFQYIVLHAQFDNLRTYQPSSWEIVYPEDPGESHVAEVRRFLEAPPLATLQRTPVVLLIGGYQNAIYEQAFREFMRGACGIEDGLIVEGSHCIDDYTAEELERFDVVLLHGYGHHSRRRAWDVLEDYIAAGGSLYIDTGWQFLTPDWELSREESPPFLPPQDLAWTDYGKTHEIELEDPLIVRGIEAAGFSPLIWEDSPWGVSSPSTGLRDWAPPVLSAEGYPIIAAGQYGEGKVVWSGMNLLGHAATYDNAAERELLRQLIAWLAPQREVSELPGVEVVREHPDHIRFVLDAPAPDRTTLLWREAYSPDWHASVRVEGERVEIPIDRAGPGLMLLHLPAIDFAGAVIEMDYRLGLAGAIGLSLSIATMALLVLLATKPALIHRVRIRLPRRKRRSIPEGTVAWLPKEPAPGEAGDAPPKAEQSMEDIAATSAPASEVAQPNELGDDGDLTDLESDSWPEIEEDAEQIREADLQADRMIRFWHKSRGSAAGAGDEGVSGDERA
jgi:hypothetical protein